MQKYKHLQLAYLIFINTFTYMYENIFESL